MGTAKKMSDAGGTAGETPAGPLPEARGPDPHRARPAATTRRRLRTTAALAALALIASSCAYIARVSVENSPGAASAQSSDPAISADGRYVAFESDGSVSVKDTVAGTTESLGGINPAISADGRYVAFQSGGVHVRDTVAGTTTEASVDLGPYDFGPSNPAISADGRYVAFDVLRYPVGRVVLVRDTVAETTTLVSVDSAGAQANGDSDYPTVSADGRYIAFQSAATNLVAGDTNGVTDIFVRDIVDGTTTRESVDSTGGEANGTSARPAISADGRYVALESSATNLAAGDTNGVTDIFVRDTVGGTTTRESVDSTGGEANGTSARPAISADGRYVAFDSDATNLAASDTNCGSDVFVRDTAAATTTALTIAGAGLFVNGDSQKPALSSDGRYVAFSSAAENLVTGDTNCTADMFVRDNLTGAMTRVSVDSTGVEANGSSAGSYGPAISGDGRYVAFESSATNLVGGDTNGASDIFVHDTVTGTTTRVSLDSTGVEADGHKRRPAISADGRYVAFHSTATNLVAGDTNGAWDIFVRDRDTDEDGIYDETAASATTRVSVDSSGAEANATSARPAISADGRYITFDSEASNLVAGDTNGVLDVFVRDTVAGTTTLVPVDDTLAQFPDDSHDPAISADGRYIVFERRVEFSPGAFSALVVRDTVAGISTAVPTAQGRSGWAPSISADGRYIAYRTIEVGGNLEPLGPWGVYVTDLVAATTVPCSACTRLSSDLFGAEANADSDYPVISADGRYIAFESSATNLAPNDTNGRVDVFVKRTVQPTITSLSPATADRDTSLTVTVDGTGFADVADASFSGSGVTVTSVTVVSDTQLDLAVTVDAGAMLDARNLTVMDMGTLGLGSGAAALCAACFTPTDPSP